MEVEYRLEDIQGYREWLESIGEDPNELTNEQIKKRLAEDF